MGLLALTSTKYIIYGDGHPQIEIQAVKHSGGFPLMLVMGEK
ncbi:MAG: hypothetical protein ACLVBJ_02815 [Pilosibacter sp.]